jgi:hypothetical protein
MGRSRRHERRLSSVTRPVMQSRTRRIRKEDSAPCNTRKVETGNNGVVEARLLIDSEVGTYALLENKIGVGVLGTTGGAIVALPTPAGGNISPVNEFT